MTNKEKEALEMYALGCISMPDVLWLLKYSDESELPDGWEDYVDTYVQEYEHFITLCKS